MIADGGVGRATFVAIAQRAGVSRGVINYHFTDRAALLDAVVVHVYELGRQVVGPRVAAADSAAAELSAMITGSIDFYRAYPQEMSALSSIFSSGEPALTRDVRGEHRSEVDEVSAIFRRGQRTGEFRPFDVAVLTVALRATLDAAVWQIAGGTDPALLSTEIDNLFTAATRSESP